MIIIRNNDNPPKDYLFTCTWFQKTKPSFKCQLLKSPHLKGKTKTNRKSSPDLIHSFSHNYPNSSLRFHGQALEHGILKICMSFAFQPLVICLLPLPLQ